MSPTSQSEVRGDPDEALRLYAIVRGDISMPPGKLAAQAGHAFLDAYLASLCLRPDIAAAYCGPGGRTKVALLAPTLRDLLRAKRDAEDSGLPCALVVDERHVLPPSFDGSPIVTALGIGPARRSEVRRITSRLALVP